MQDVAAHVWSEFVFEKVCDDVIYGCGNFCDDTTLCSIF